MGRRSGGMTGTTSRIIARGSLIRRPWSSRVLKALTIRRRRIALCLRCADSGLVPSGGDTIRRSSSSWASKSDSSMSRAMASAPIPPSK